MSGQFFALFQQDLRLALRHLGDVLTAVFFFALIACLFPFGLGAEPNLLARIGPGVIWVAALLSVLLSLERLFHADYEDGSLELLVLSPLPLELSVLAKTLALWVSTSIPVILSTPVIGLFYHFEARGLPVMLLAMVLGSLSLCLIGAAGAALSLGARRGGVLVPLLMLPLYLPILIFGVGAVDAALGGFSAKAPLFLLGAILALMVFVAPFAAAAALRQAME